MVFGSEVKIVGPGIKDRSEAISLFINPERTSINSKDITESKDSLVID